MNYIETTLNISFPDNIINNIIFYTLFSYNVCMPISVKFDYYTF